MSTMSRRGVLPLVLASFSNPAPWWGLSPARRGPEA